MADGNLKFGDLPELAAAAEVTDEFTVLDKSETTGDNADAGGQVKRISGTNLTQSLTPASVTVSGRVELATIAETDTGTDAARALTPAGLKGSALQTKVDGIEALADVTDATNVNAAGATMNADADVSGNSWVVDEDNMASDSATQVPTQQSVKAYVANLIANGVEFQGGYNATTNVPDLDTSPSGIEKGDLYVVETAGSAFFTLTLEVGDMLLAEQDNPTLEAHWSVVQSNLTAASIKTAYESNSDTNAFTDADETKLDGIEAAADVTDATNVATAGAIMDGDVSGNGLIARTAAGTYSERTIAGTANEISVANGDGQAANPTIGIADDAVLPGTGAATMPSGLTGERPTPANGMLRYNTTSNQFEAYENGAWIDMIAAASGIGNIVEDTTPQLGGQLDVNGQAIGDGTLELLTFVEDASAVNHIEIENEATGSGPILRSTGDDTDVDLNIEAKGTGDVIIDGRTVATDAAKLDGIEALADVTDATNVNAAGATMNTDADVSGNSWVVDEDDMSSDSATQVPTQQSVKAYVANLIANGVEFQGAYNATTNSPDLDTSPSGIEKGDLYVVDTAGSAFFTVTLEVGDMLMAEQDNPTLESHWSIVQSNLTAASIKTAYESNSDTNAYTDSEQTVVGNTSGTNTGDEVAADLTTAGVVELATGAETNTGTDATRAVTPDGLDDWTGSTQIATVAEAAVTAHIAAIKPTESIIIACSDETTALTTGTAKVTFRMPYAFTLTGIRASVTTAPTGAILIVDVNDGGTTIMTTDKLDIDISEKTTTTAATAPTLTDTALADDAEITIDIDQVGSTIAGAGLKVYLIGTRT